MVDFFNLFKMDQIENLFQLKTLLIFYEFSTAIQTMALTFKRLFSNRTKLLKHLFVHNFYLDSIFDLDIFLFDLWVCNKWILSYSKTKIFWKSSKVFLNPSRSNRGNIKLWKPFPAKKLLIKYAIKELYLFLLKKQ